MDRPIGALELVFTTNTLNILSFLSVALKKWGILTQLYVKESNVVHKFIMVAKTVIGFGV